VINVDAPLQEIEQQVSQALGTVTGVEVVHDRWGWSWLHKTGRMYAVIDTHAGLADASLELIRPLRSLGFSGGLEASNALEVLLGSSQLLHARVAVGPHPDGSRHQALLLQGTLYLADLDEPELCEMVAEMALASVKPA